MVTSWAALPFREPLAVQEGAMDEEVIDIILSSMKRDRGSGGNYRRGAITDRGGKAVHRPTQVSPSMGDVRDQRSTQPREGET